MLRPPRSPALRSAATTSPPCRADERRCGAGRRVSRSKRLFPALAVLLYSVLAACGTGLRQERSSPSAVSSAPLTAPGPRARSSAPGPRSAPVAPGFPNAANTGVPAGTRLKRSRGLTIDRGGAVIRGLDINGAVVVNAPNVTIRDSRIRSDDIAGIANNSTGLVIENVEVDCGNVIGHTGITSKSYTAVRVNAHGCDNTFWAERDVVIRDSYVHGLVNYDPATDPHTDGVQVPSGASNITIDHNTINGNYVNHHSFGNS